MRRRGARPVLQRLANPSRILAGPRAASYDGSSRKKTMSLPPTDRVVKSLCENLIIDGSVARLRAGRAHFIALAIAVVVSTGCGAGPIDKLEGKWVGERIDNVSAEQVVRATAWVKATTLEFAGDKLTVTIPTEPARKGTFKVAKVDGDKVVLSVRRKDSPTRDESTFMLQGDKTLRWDIGQSREITLVRAQ
jgi:hypothetical protein